MNVNYRQLFEEAPVGIILCSRDGKIVDCNRAFADIIGVSVTQARDFTYWDITPGPYHPLEREILEFLNQVNEFGPYEKEYYYQPRIGDNQAADPILVPVSLQIKTITIDDVPFLWATVTKINRLGEGFNTLFLQLPIAIVVSDVKGNFVAANQKYAELLGRPLTEVLTISYWNITPKAYEKAEEQLRDELIKHGKRDDYLKHYIHGNGHLIPVSLDLRLHVIHGRQYFSAIVRPTGIETGSGTDISAEPIVPINNNK